EPDGPAGRHGERLVPRALADERLRAGPPQAQRRGGQGQLLLRETRRRAPGVEGAERARERLEVDGPPVVGVDERRAGDLGALVDVGDAGDGELEQLRDRKSTRLNS